MVDGAPGYDGAASDPPCYNCGMRGHWFNACPEPTRKLPAGLEASLAARQNTRDGPTSDTQALNRRGKGPVITRYPLPHSPVSGLGRYDAPAGLPPHPPPPPPPPLPLPPASYAPPGSYGQSYAPPYHTHGHHYDPYSHGASPPPPPHVSGPYHQYRQHLSHAYGPPPHSQAPYMPPNDTSRGRHDNYAHPRSSQFHQYPELHGHDGPSHHYSYPAGYDYPRHSSPYSNTPPISFHKSPPPEYRHPHFTPSHYHDGHGRDRSPRDLSRDRWQSRSHRQPDEDYGYNNREYERGRPRYSPPRQTSPRQGYDRERSPQHGRPPMRDDPQRHDRRRDKRGSAGTIRKPEKDRGRQSQQKSSEKPASRPPRFEKSQSSGQAQTNDSKPMSKPDVVVQWGLVVPYMPVWDFEADEANDESDKTTAEKLDKDTSYDEDDDIEWSNSQLFAEWVPMMQSRAICRPLPPKYSEDDITPPTGYDAVLQTKFITPHNVDQFSMSIRETKEWRHKKGLPMFTDPMDIHPRMLAQVGGRERSKDENIARDGRSQHQKKTNWHQHHRKESQDTESGKPLLRNHKSEARHLSNDKNRYGQNGTNSSPPGKTESTVIHLRESDNDQVLRRDSRSKSVGNPQGDAGRRSSRESSTRDLVHADTNHRSEHERRLSDEAASNMQTTSNQRNGLHTSKSSAPSPAQDFIDDDQVTLESAEPDEIAVSHATRASEFHATTQVFPSHERPPSRNSLRSWCTRTGRNSRPLSRRGSVVSDISRPESPLTPTEMALLGIDMDLGSDSEHAIDDKPETVAVTKVSETKQKRQHQEDDTNMTPKGVRLGKRQAAAVASEEVTPRTKKRRQQVASAFSRRW